MTKPLIYQREGVDALHEANGRALLADSMGLGKTLQVLLYMQEANHRNAVIVCPKALKLHWQREALQHCGMKVKILSGTTPHQLSKGIYVINYDILRPWLGHLRRLQPTFIAGDECQAFGNLRAQRTKAFKALCAGVDSIICMSGTPLVNRPWELFPVLNILRPKLFPSAFQFGHQFCDATRMFGRWEFKGAKNLKKLHRIMRLNVPMIRRTKAEVLKDLPEKRQMVIPLEIEKRKEYEKAERDFIAWLKTWDLARARRAALNERFTRFTYLKKFAAQLKMKVVIEIIKSFLQETSEKLLLGCIHHDIMDRLFDEFGKISVVINGKKTSRQRQEAEDTYRKNKKCRILIGQIKACGVGLNLPETTKVLTVEFPWAPGDLQQFWDRGHRMTSTHALDCINLVAHGTIEEKLCKILQDKQGTLDRVLDGVARQENSVTVFDLLQAAMLEKANG